MRAVKSGKTGPEKPSKAVYTWDLKQIQEVRNAWGHHTAHIKSELSETYPQEHQIKESKEQLINKNKNHHIKNIPIIRQILAPPNRSKT